MGAIIADNKPKKVTLEAGKTYAFCSCGRTKSEPFCDGGHSGTGITPKIFTVETTSEKYLCCCKQTKNSPYCDGAHADIPSSEIGKEKN